VEELKKEASKLAADITNALTVSHEFVAEVILTSDPSLDVTPSVVAMSAFTCFRPDRLGEVEFHTSRRFYARETSVDNIRLRVASRTEERRNRFLYDLENKYKNIKTQLGEEFVAGNHDTEMEPVIALLGAGVVGGVVGANIADDGATTSVSEQPAVVRAEEAAVEPTSIEARS
jgi:hypothetical protein